MSNTPTQPPWRVPDEMHEPIPRENQPEPDELMSNERHAVKRYHPFHVSYFPIVNEPKEFVAATDYDDLRKRVTRLNEMLDERDVIALADEREESRQTELVAKLTRERDDLRKQVATDLRFLRNGFASARVLCDEVDWTAHLDKLLRELEDTP